MAHTLPEKPVLRIDEVAFFFAVHPATVKRWIDSGQLDAFQLPSGYWRIRRETVLAFADSLKTNKNT